MEAISDNFKNKKFLASCLFLSGATSLTFECLWFRQLGLLLGSSHLASSYLLTLLMLGFALGAYWAPFLRKSYPYPLKLYGMLEIFIGLYTLACFFGLKRLPLSFLYQSRFFTGALVLLPPTIAMGATLPILCDSLFLHLPKTSGRFYGINTLGAVVGTGMCGFFLLPYFGLTWSYIGASTLCVLVGILLLLINSNFSTPEIKTEEKSPNKPLCLFYFCLGFIALSYQNFWTRTLILVLGSSSYAFTIVLLTFLLATALGSILFSYLRFKGISYLGFLQILGAAGGFFSIVYLTHLPDLYFKYFNFFGTEKLYWGQFIFCFCLMAPTCLLLGATFPAIISIAPSRRNVSHLYTANTLGGALAPFLLGILLLYVFTIHQALLFTVAFQFLLGFVLISWKLRGLALLLMTSLFLLIGLPQWKPESMTSANYLYVRVRQSPKEFFEKWKQLAYKEGVSGVVTVEEEIQGKGFRKVLRINGKEASGYADLPTEITLAHLPFAFHPAPKKALVIGFGGGITVGSTLLHPLDKVYCAELVPEVLAMEPFFHEINYQPLDNPTLSYIAEDGRAFLASLKEPLDIIISQPSNPWISGAASLFTKEFYQLGLSKLSSQGVFCQWVQTYEISWTSLGALINAFQQVFPYTYAFHPRKKADLLLIGLKKPLRFSPEFLLENPAVAKDLARANIFTEEDLVNSFILLPAGKKFNSFPLNSDDDGYVEFHTPYELFNSNYQENNVKLHQFRSSLMPLIKEECDFEAFSENALKNGELELATYWALHSLKEGSSKWADSRIAYLYSLGMLKKIPLGWFSEIGAIGESYQLKFEAEQAFSKGKVNHTLEMLRKSVALWPQNREAHLRLGMILDYRRNQKESAKIQKEAYHHFQMVRALGGENHVVREKCQNLCRAIIFEAYNAKQWQEILNYLEEYKDLQEKADPVLEKFKLEAFENLALAAFQKKDWAVVIENLKQYQEITEKLTPQLEILYQQAFKNWLNPQKKSPPK